MTEFDFGPEFSEEDYIQMREEQWHRGEHHTQKGDVINVSEMATPHLQNTINKFKDTHDVSALEKELKKRQ